MCGGEGRGEGRLASQGCQIKRVLISGSDIDGDGARYGPDCVDT